MIIAIAGPAGSGKTTIARHLMKKYNFLRVRFAGPIKDMGRAFGLSDEQLDGEMKEVPDNIILNGKTPRQFMRLLGTEFGRQLIDDNVWVNLWKRRVHEAQLFQHVVCDDVRHQNEVNAVVQHFDHLLITVRRPGFEPSDEHSSENSIGDVGTVIHNTGSIETLTDWVDDLLSGMLP